MNTTTKVAISGAGRVFERLYLPAMRRLPQVEVVAVADPARERRTTAIPGAPAFDSLRELLTETAVDAVIVLSPPAAHPEDAAAALERGVPVLVEKPMCQSFDEVERLRALGADGLLTPAFSRRYWPAYRRVAQRGPVRALRLAIRVVPDGWGAYSGPTDIAEDLFPHVADLARWLTGSEIEEIRARRGARGVEAALSMSQGQRLTARLDTGEAYREAVRADGSQIRVGPPTTLASALRRIGRRDDPPVEAIRAMLSDWLVSGRGERTPLLPRFEDGAASVVAMERLRSAIG